jgi:hypothetical protein
LVWFIYLIVYTDRKSRSVGIVATVQLLEFQNFILNTDMGLEDFGFDDISTPRGMDLLSTFVMNMILLGLIFKWLKKGTTYDDHQNGRDNTQHTTAPPTDFQLLTSEDLGRGEIQDCHGTATTTTNTTTTATATANTLQSTLVQDCCSICLEAMPIGTTVSILPCRHSFHPICIDHWFLNTAQARQQYSCPLCKMDLVPHFQERLSARRAILQPSRNRQQHASRYTWWYWSRNLLLGRLGYRDRSRSHQDVLLDDNSDIVHDGNAASLGDLELTVEVPPTSVLVSASAPAPAVETVIPESNPVSGELGVMV